jgi:hypothetical protein
VKASVQKGFRRSSHGKRRLPFSAAPTVDIVLPKLSTAALKRVQDGVQAFPNAGKRNRDDWARRFLERIGLRINYSLEFTLRTAHGPQTSEAKDGAIFPKKGCLPTPRNHARVSICVWTTLLRLALSTQPRSDIGSHPLEITPEFLVCDYFAELSKTRFGWKASRKSNSRFDLPSS